MNKKFIWIGVFLVTAGIAGYIVYKYRCQVPEDLAPETKPIVVNQ